MTDADPEYTGPERRRSRFGWPTQTEPTTTPAGTHSHKMPTLHTRILYGCVVLLLLVNAGLLIYVLGRGAARDAAEERVQREIRDSWCQALDGFPEGNPFLDPLRERYGCGPGIPLDELPDDVRQRYQPQPTAPATASPTPTTQAPMGAPAVPNPPRGDRTYTPAPPDEES